MARLTWENVNAPSFAGVSDAYRTMGTLLSNATRAGIDVLDTFKGAQNEAADRALLQRAIAIQDPNAYRTALADGSLLGSDGSRASVRGLQAIDDRVGSLINRATSQNDLDWTQYTQDRARSGNQVLDANADTINRARSLAVAGDMTGAQRLLSGVPGLRTDQFNDILGDVDQYGNRALSRDVTRLGMDVTRQNLTEDRYGFGRLMMGDTATDEAQGVLREIQRTASTTQDARVALEAMADRLSPQTFARAQQLLAGAGYGNVYAPIGAGGAPGAAPAAGGGAGARSGPLPAQGSQWAAAVGLTGNESGGNYGASNNAMGAGGQRGHFGALQFGHARLNDAKAAGVIPQSMTAEQFRTAGKEVQDKVADWHFNKIDSDAEAMGLNRAIGTTIAGVPITRDSIRAMAHLGGIGGVQRFIQSNGTYNPADENGTRLSDYGQRFGGGTPSPTNQEAGFAGLLAGLQTSERVGQNNARGISRAYLEGVTDQSDANQVATSLVGEGGPLAGSHRATIKSYVDWIVDNSGGRINPAQAGQLLAENTTKEDNVVQRAGSILLDVFGMPFGRKTRTPNLANGMRIDDQGVYAGMEDLLSGRTSQRFVANQSAAAAQQMAQQATATYQSALAQYQAVLLDSQTRPGAAQNLPRYREALQQAKANMDAVLQRVGGNENWNPDWDVPEPDPVTGLISSAVKG